MLFRVVLLTALTLAAAAETCAGPHEACDPGGSGFKKIDCCPGSTCYRQEPAGEGGSYICLGSYQLAIEDEHRFPVEKAAKMVLADAGACKKDSEICESDDECCEGNCASIGQCQTPTLAAEAAQCTADDATKSSTVKFSCDAVKCAKSNFFKLDPTAACIAKEDGVSSGCANCFGQVSQCVVKHCAVKCLVDPTAPACQACGHAACDDLAKSCTGLATLPPDAKDCPKAEANFLVV